MMNFRRLKETYLYNHKSLTPATLWTIFLKLVIFNIWCPLVHYERLTRGAVWLKVWLYYPLAHQCRDFIDK